MATVSSALKRTPGNPFYIESVHGNAKRLPGGVFDGQMRSPQYVGVAPLAYRDSGPSHVFNANDQGKYVNPVGEQPRTSKWWETRDFWGLNTDLPNLQSDSEQGIYETFSGTTDANPTVVNAMANALTFGPYNLAVGEKAKIVVAYVAGDRRAGDIPRWPVGLRNRCAGILYERYSTARRRTIGAVEQG